MSQKKLGLALSGGGARGAYEVGVVRALAKMKLDPVHIAGASIGALNGAVVASSPSIQQAAVRLETLWRELNPEAILKVRGIPEEFGWGSVLDFLKEKFAGDDDSQDNGWSEQTREVFSILDSGALDDILSRAIDINGLYKKKEFHVSVFPGSEDPGLRGSLEDLIHWIRSDQRSEFIRLKDFNPGQVLPLLKASAAIPLAFQAQAINGRFYRDGGIGNRVNSQGNTPIEPLTKGGCKQIIVAFIRDSGEDELIYPPGIQIAVIHPSQSVEGKGSLRSLFDFSPERIAELIALGEEDAMKNPDLWAVKRGTSQFAFIFDAWNRIFPRTHRPTAP